MLGVDRAFVKAHTCYRLTAVAVVPVKHEFSLLMFSFKVVIVSWHSPKFCKNYSPLTHHVGDTKQRFLHTFIQFYKEPEACVTQMLETLEPSSLEQRRIFNRLVLMYKVVEGLVPAIPADDYWNP